MMSLDNFLRAVFDEGGILADLLPSYRYNPLQYQYARDVADILHKGATSARTAIGLLEADTGTGKSLGYLIPLGWLAAQGQRVAISTFTNHLLQQGLRHSWPVVHAAVRELLGVSLRAAPRMGLRNFISTKRVEEFIATLDNPDPAILAPFHRWLAHGSGILHDWLDDYGSLPFGMKPDQVCCQPYDAHQELEQYSSHLDRARQADVVFTNHALSILHIMGRSTLDGDRSLSAVLFDEADQLDNVAKQLVSKRVSLRVLRRLVANSREYSDDARIQRASADFEQLLDSVMSELEESRPPSVSVLPLVRGAELFHSASRRVYDGLQGFMEQIERANLKEVLPDHWLDEMGVLSAILCVVAKGRTGHADAVPAIAWSDKHQIPSFLLVSVDAGRIMAQFARDSEERTKLASIVFTSATLSDGRSAGLDAQARKFGFFSNSHDIEKRRYEPEQFGTVEFILMDPVLPSPTDNASDSSRSNVEWVSNVAAMIRCAYEEGGRVLALMLSRRDVESIAEHLQGVPGLLVHGKGVRLSELLEDYKRSRNSVLLSASAWEGVDLPGYIQHLVITRLPYGPPDDPESVVQISKLVMAGYSRKVAERIVFAQMLSDARRKFRQGFGRGIRRHDDQVRVWIGDPRFLSSAFPSILPRRFRESVGLASSPLDRAQIWRPGEAMAMPDSSAIEGW